MSAYDRRGSESGEGSESRHSVDLSSGHDSATDRAQDSDSGSQSDRDDGYHSMTQDAYNTIPEDMDEADDPEPGRSVFWQGLVDLDELQEGTQRLYPGKFTNGTILGWRGNGFGYSVIVGYEVNGITIARVEALRRRELPGNETHIPSTCRGKKKMNQNDYWTQGQVRSVGLVAWRVEDAYRDDPTSVLRPMRKAWYPETYIQIIWRDGLFTWENRDNFRHILCKTNIEADIFIYRIAISQQGDYEFALTGRRPEFPDGGNMQNLHWRNTNAHGNAHWLTPRARKEARVVSLNEEPSGQFNEHSHQARYRYSGRATNWNNHSEGDGDKYDYKDHPTETNEESGEDVDSEDPEDDIPNADDIDGDSDDSTQQTPTRGLQSSISRSRRHQASIEQDTPTAVYTPANGPRRRLSSIEEEFVTPQSRPQPQRHQTASSRSQTPRSIFSASRGGSTPRTPAELDNGLGRSGINDRGGSRQSSQSIPERNNWSRRSREGTRSSSARGERPNRSGRSTPRPHTDPKRGGLNARSTWPFNNIRASRSPDSSRAPQEVFRGSTRLSNSNRGNLSNKTPDSSRSKGKKSDSTLSSSRSKGKAREEQRSDSTPDTARSKGKAQEEQRSDSTPSSSRSKGKAREEQRLDSTPSSSRSKGKAREEQRSDSTPSSSRSKGKAREEQRSDSTPSSSKGKAREDQRSDRTPSSSRSNGKAREEQRSDSTPSSSRSNGKAREEQRSDSTPSSSKGKAREEQRSDSTPSSLKSKVRGPIDSHSKRNQSAGAIPGSSGSKKQKKKAKGKRGSKFAGDFRRPATRSKGVEFA
ncbi:hypothetical protein N7532_001420 [Penicillium argentinense]|uniref:Uncharacterized protein n=1 Tax=Penicillium argentinense TaxID=1131581 RepID=A0A9W9G3B5_9EURO|nr:uncharacterized protein N7532_001420 [Penicillium argentinense]KAJ5110885.1 hypothetical protein N7532_001420 [Penicillium argentinense]